MTENIDITCFCFKAWRHAQVTSGNRDLLKGLLREERYPNRVHLCSGSEIVSGS